MRKTDPVIDAMRADSLKEHRARMRVATVLGRLPDNYSRRKVLRAVAVLLDCPHIMGDRPNA